MGRSVGKGVTLERGQPGFDAAVLGTSFNARDPGRRPAVVVQANGVDDVVAAVRRARADGLRLSVCSGGHSWPQNHIRDGSLLIDLGRMTAMTVDADALTATVEPGRHCGDVDAMLARQGLFFPVAHAWTVGIGGFLLQGGFGWNSRQMGLGCENVLGVDVVLADGSLVHASARENPDLYWAARGSGPGFFGVVVRFHLRLHRRPKVIGLKLQVFRIEHLEEVLRWADAVGPSVSRSVEFQMVLNRKAMIIGAPGIEVVAPVLADSWQEARDATAFLRRNPVVKKASVNLPLLPAPLGFVMRAGEKSLFMPGVRWRADNMWMDGPIEPLLPAIRDIAATQPPSPSHVLWLNWNPPPTRPDMAFSIEGRTYLALYGGVRTDAEETAHNDWASRHMKALEPFSKGIQLADENLADRPARFLSDLNMARLDSIRAAYDPDGLFNPWMGRAN